MVSNNKFQKFIQKLKAKTTLKSEKEVEATVDEVESVESTLIPFCNPFEDKVVQTDPPQVDSNTTEPATGCVREWQFLCKPCNGGFAGFIDSITCGLYSNTASCCSAVCQPSDPVTQDAKED